MAKIVDFIEIPESSMVFAGNPIVFKAQSYYTLAETESFHRIICVAVFKLEDVLPYYTGSRTFSVELSQVVGEDKTATFNLSDAAQTLIKKVQAQLDVNLKGDLFSSYNLTLDVSVEEAWIRDNEEIRGGGAGGGQVRIYIVPGGMTDFELLTKNNTNLFTLAYNGTYLTRKPDGGIVYKGEQLILPTLKTVELSSDTQVITSLYRFTVGDKYVTNTGAIYCNKLDYHFTDTSLDAPDGDFTFTSNVTGTLSGYYRTNTRGVHFLRFINGFGAVENISVRAKDKLTYEVSGETHSLVQEISTRPTDRRYATKSQPVGVYELSSGYVPQRWAEWYVQELLTSPRVWILLGGKWVPALIEAEDDCVIYDRTKPEMPHVDFTLRLAIDGVTGITW